MKIFKYQLDVTNAVAMPAGAKILDAQFQSNGKLNLWALVDEKTEFIKVKHIQIYGTGNPMPDDPGRYIATVQQDGCVWHIFERDE